MSEKITDHLMLNAYSTVFGHEYHTETNKTLFGKYVPDGWDIIEDYLVIIENKKDVTKSAFKEALQQICNYYSCINIDDYKDVFLIIGMGTGEAFRYYVIDQNTWKISNETLEDLFALTGGVITSNASKQAIHNDLVNCFHYDKAEELHDILTIIVLSFMNDDIKEYYKLNHNDILSSEFINKLIDNAKSCLSNSNDYNKYFETIKNTKFDNCFKVCKKIYETYKVDKFAISDLFQQFKKYKTYDMSKNEIWTEKTVCDIMFNTIKPLCDKIYEKNKCLTVLDPCIGGNNLIRPFIDTYDNILINGCDINKRLYIMSKFDFTINGIDNLIYCKDFMENDISDNSLMSNVCICNPPYSKNVSKHESIEFLNKATKLADICCFIFPENQLKLSSTIKYRNDILETHYIYKIIALGDKIFKDASTGNIIIIVTINRQKYKNIIGENYSKTLYYDLSNMSNKNYYYKVPRSNCELTKLGKELLNNYYENKIEPVLYTITDSNWLPNDESNILDDIYEFMKQKVKNKIYGLVMKDIDNAFNAVNSNEKYIETRFDIYNIVKDELTKINNYTFSEYKLSDLFQEVKVKKYSLSSSNEGDIPLYGATKDGRVLKYIDCISIDGNNEYITINKDGSYVGYCFKAVAPFAVIGSVNVYEPLVELNNEDLELISYQLNKMFDYGNKLNKTNFDKTTVYLKDI